MSLTLRRLKGRALTQEEMDRNLEALGSFQAAPAGAVARPVRDKLRDLPASPGDYADADSLLASPPEKVFQIGTFILKALDGAEQFRVGWTPGAVENWRAYGGGLRTGATLVAGSDTSPNVDGNFVAQGAGGFYYANGSGVLAAVEGSGSGNRVANHLALRPGDAGKPGALAAASWGGEANVGIALTPLGNGALSAHTPDNTAAGGNPRGAFATDWQRSRSSPVHVASSSGSTVGGGDSNTASNAHATVSGGSLNTASGDKSWVPGGLRATTAGVHGKGAWASGRFAADGDAQAGEGVLRGRTTSATPVRLTSDAAAPGAANTWNLRDNAAVSVKVKVVARRSDGGGKADWELDALMTRDAGAGTTVIASAATTAQAPTRALGSTTGWTVQLGADTTNGGLAVTATGPAGFTVSFVARVMSVEEIG